jgi:hypothetical protein
MSSPISGCGSVVVVACDVVGEASAVGGVSVVGGTVDGKVVAGAASEDGGPVVDTTVVSLDAEPPPQPASANVAPSATDTRTFPR